MFREFLPCGQQMASHTVYFMCILLCFVSRGYLAEFLLIINYNNEKQVFINIGERVYRDAAHLRISIHDVNSKLTQNASKVYSLKYRHLRPSGVIQKTPTVWSKCGNFNIEA